MHTCNTSTDELTSTVMVPDWLSALISTMYTSHSLSFITLINSELSPDFAAYRRYTHGNASNGGTVFKSLCSHNFSFAGELTSASVFYCVLPFMVALTWIPGGFGIAVDLVDLVLVDLVGVDFVGAMSLVKYVNLKPDWIDELFLLARLLCTLLAEFEVNNTKDNVLPLIALDAFMLLVCTVAVYFECRAICLSFS